MYLCGWFAVQRHLAVVWFFCLRLVGCRNGGWDVKGHHGGLHQEIIGQYYFVMFLLGWFLTDRNQRNMSTVY